MQEETYRHIPTESSTPKNTNNASIPFDFEPIEEETTVVEEDANSMTSEIFFPKNESVKNNNSEITEQVRMDVARSYLNNYLSLNEKSLFEKIQSQDYNINSLSEETIKKIVQQLTAKDRLQSTYENQKYAILLIIRFTMAIMDRYSVAIGNIIETKELLQELKSIYEVISNLKMDLYVINGLLDRQRVIDITKKDSTPLKTFVELLQPVFFTVLAKFSLQQFCDTQLPEPETKKRKLIK